MKVEYVKVECDIWDIATLKDDFEAGNLVTKIGECFQVVNKLDYVVASITGGENVFFGDGELYRRTETPVTFESELYAIDDELDIFIHNEDDVFISCKESGVGINIKTDKAHQLSEILKKYGK